jgi:hypothetical protein
VDFYARRVLARRLLVLTAVLLLLMTVAAALAPQPEVEPPEGSAPSLRAGRPVESTISAAEGANARVPVRRGDVLTLEVEGDTLDAVLLERLDRIDAIEPTTPARFTMLVEAPAGIYPIRLVDADRRIGMIEVSD